uniref:Uncharacterized protein n=1 Tax=viral metagenome TaxID=1070528 RepID=A0A6M3IXW0_9ZZZZ
MNQQEKEKIIEVANHLLNLNNKTFFLAKGEYVGIMLIKKIADEANELGGQCFNELIALVQNSKPEVMTVDEFVHSPVMGG